MANWNDPQPPRTGFGASPSLDGRTAGRAAAYDMGLRKHMLSIYNYMASGVLLTGIVALLMARSGLALALMGTPLRWLFILSPLAIVLAMSFGQGRFSTGTLKAMFWGFATLMGNDAVSGTGGSGGFGTPPGTSGLIGSATGSAVQADADLILNTSVVMGAGVASACEGMAITQRTANLVSDASCPGTVVTDLDLQFQPIDSLDPSPHFTPLPTSDAVDTSPDCLDPLGAEAVVLDQLIATRPMTYHAAPVCDFGAIEFTPVIFADGFETPPPPP